MKTFKKVLWVIAILAIIAVVTPYLFPDIDLSESRGWALLIRRIFGGIASFIYTLLTGK